MAIRVPQELIERDPLVLAPLVGLTADGDDHPGITRHRAGTGFSYRDAFGSLVADDVRERIEQLAIPPAWTDVWIASRADNYLLASGLDDAGRKQYRYHDEFRALSDRRKFERLTYFARAVVVLRKAVAEALDQPMGSRDHAVAAAVRLIDECLLRVGNHRSAANGHFGASTLTVEHVLDDGHVTLDYVAKSGQTRTIVIEDDDLADILTDLAADADAELFWFEDTDARDESDERRRATATDINRFIVEHAGPAFSAKDFRTWGGSAVALERRAAGDRLLDAIDAAADELGNTRAVARSAYIHPAVTEVSADVIDRHWSASRSSKWMAREERALAKLLQSSVHGAGLASSADGT